MILRLFLFLLVTLGVVSVSLAFGTRVAIDETVKREALKEAEHYARYMSTRIPALDRLVETGKPTIDQLQTIREVQTLGDVFRFKLFDAAGHLVLVSDAIQIRSEATISGIEKVEPARVARTGETLVAIFDGTEKPGRPDLYAEAHVPLTTQFGDVYGVAEVHVDQTDTRQYFYDSFKRFGVMLTIVCSVLFSVPYLGYAVQRVRTEASEKDAEFLASYDSLTGLINRREFVERANAMIARGDLSAICFIDVDKFKSINDMYGHATGDKLLAHIAEILRSGTSHKDLTARFGGDEFVIGFNRLGVDGVVRRIRAIMAETSVDLDTGDAVLGSSLSVGIAASAPGQDLDELLSHADAALYHSKANGRNMFSVYGDAMGEELRRRNALEALLRRATREKDFVINYQPLVSGKTEQIVGYEALLRLVGDDGEAIPPSVFIPVAEEVGLIREIGSWVIRTATKQIACTDDHSTVAINLSAAQFSDGDLPALVQSALEEANLPPERLELEITESLLLEDDPAVALQIDTLKEMGVSIAMDDFGTGFSSLSYLWRFGFDRLKIDRSFVAALHDDPVRSREIIETIMVLGDRLGMQITAEGIETAEQSAYLARLGCDKLQGYLYGRPESLPAGGAKSAEDQGPEPRRRVS